MGSGHAHGDAGGGTEAAAARPVEGIVLGIVVAIVVVTLVGLAVLWPGRPAPSSEALPSQFHAAITAATDQECPADDAQFAPARTGPCQLLEVAIADGPDAGTTIEFDTATGDYPTFRTGDRVFLGLADQANGGSSYYIGDFDRLRPMLALFLVFVAFVILVGRWHGLRALLGLGISLGIVVFFVVPGVISGQNPFLIALVGALAVMIVTLYLSHGLTMKTSAALVGTAAALTLTATLGVLFVGLTRITGFSSEEVVFVRQAVEGLDVRGLVLAGLVIGALGVLDDVTVGQASTVFEVHGADPTQSWRQVFQRAMNVGRDHIAATVNTLVLAYAGASIVLLLLFSTTGLALTEIINSEVVAVEIVTTLVGSLGLISAVPITTALATTLALRQRTTPATVLPAHLSVAAEVSELTAEERAHRAWVALLGSRLDSDLSGGATTRDPDGATGGDAHGATDGDPHGAREETDERGDRDA